MERIVLNLNIVMMVSLLVFLVMTSSGCSAMPESLDTKESHHTNTGFRNFPYVETASSKGIMFVLRRIQGSTFHPDIPEGHHIPEDQTIAQLKKLSNDNIIAWLGHSTFLLKIGDQTILTDPFLTNRASPVSFIGGVTRYVPPGISINNLPTIDVIIISHNHYDQLDEHTVCAIPNRDRTHVFVPLAVKDIFIECGYKNVHELDWWENKNIGKLNIVSLPAVHDSGRSLTDKDDTLWSSWGIISDDKKYYFGGDTGYSPVFKKIGERYGPFNLAILPIGAYEPRKLMWMSHVTPEEAVEIGIDIKSINILGGHWGTIELSDEDHWEPPVRFMSSGIKAGFDLNNIWIMKIGEVKKLP